MFKSIDQMKWQQDRASNPPSDTEKDKAIKVAKSLGAEYLALSTPYDVPSGYPSADSTTTAWVNVIRANGMKVWHRHSWASDEGFYGVARNYSNDRINDTKNWILNHASLFANGDIFCPKPEPQNMRVIGINWGDPATARFTSVALFNTWLRNMTAACKAAFTQIGKDVKVGYWGFDGFVACGYNNPDWTGKTFLEPATVSALDNVVAVDHYPSLVNKPMSDFIRVFKQALPTAKLVIGENGSANSADPGGQFSADWQACLADSVCIGYNYWTLGPDGGSEKLMNSDFSLTAVGNKVKELWAGTSTTTVAPSPTSTSTTTVAPTPTTTSTTLPPVTPSQVIEIGAETPYVSGYNTFYRELKINGVVVGKIRVYRRA